MKKKLSAILAMLMLCACGQGAAPAPEVTLPEPPDTTITTTAAPEETTVTTVSTADPFADMGGGAVTSVSHNVKTADTETEAEETAVPEKVTEKGGDDTSDSSAGVMSETSSKGTKKKGGSDEKTAAKSSGSVKLSISETGGWNDGTSDFKQYSIKVKNSSKKYVSSWTITIPFSSKATVDQFWCTDLTMSGGTITAKNLDYNGSIAPGAEAEFGIIMKNPGTPDKSKATIKCEFGSAPSWDNGNNNGGGGGQVTSSPAKDVPAPSTDDWLSTRGNKIVDSKGKEVWLTGINWFGYNTGTNTFDGLWACDLNTSINAIADHGFNLLRVPFSAELINQWAAGDYPTANYNHAYNDYLNDMNSLEIWDYIVGQCRANGLKIMIDIHSAKTDASGHMKPMWYEGDVTEKDYLAALKWMAKRYKDDDTIIAFDLKNEPHGKANENPRAKWDDSYDPDNWHYEAEKAANVILTQNPNVLIMVEGIEIYPKEPSKGFNSKSPDDYYSTWWGANLRGVKDYPVNLGKYKNKLVYSPHDYGPSVYQQEWFKGDYNYNSLKKDAWNDNWLYIHENGTAPILIGEWGGFMNDSNLKWMKALRKLIKENHLHHTFWCFNANSGDTGGMVKDDFITWDEEKYAFVKPVLWQEDGKFVGLDHKIPLGKKGKTLD